jgi:hypothetical protein
MTIRRVLYINQSLMPAYDAALRNECGGLDYTKFIEIGDPFTLTDGTELPQIREFGHVKDGESVVLTYTGLRRSAKEIKRIVLQQTQQEKQAQAATPTTSTSEKVSETVRTPDGSTGRRLGFEFTPKGGFNDDKISSQEIAAYIQERQQSDAAIEKKLASKH